MEQYKIVVKLKEGTQEIVHENLTYSEMLAYYKKYQLEAVKKPLGMTVWHLESSESEWVKETVFENGFIVEAFGVKRQQALAH